MRSNISYEIRMWGIRFFTFLVRVFAWHFSRRLDEAHIFAYLIRHRVHLYFLVLYWSKHLLSGWSSLLGKFNFWTNTPVTHYIRSFLFGRNRLFFANMRVRCQVQLTFGKQMQRNFVVYLRGIFALVATYGVNQAELSYSSILNDKHFTSNTSYFKLCWATCFGLHWPSSGPFVNRVLQMLVTYWDPTMFTTMPVCIPDK